MKPAAAIRRAGFRKWYERQLLQGHAHMVLLLLCTIAMLGAAEAFGTRGPEASPVSMLLCAAVSAVIGVWALRRYLYLLNHAEYMANQAVCRQCTTYAKWDVVGEESQGASLQVCCRRCGHRWRIDF
ncbi:MAG TPA: hypothetical protein VIP10_12040 [Burkholderiaceae bacterium]